MQVRGAVSCQAAHDNKMEKLQDAPTVYRQNFSIAAQLWPRIIANDIELVKIFPGVEGTGLGAKLQHLEPFTIAVTKRSNNDTWGLRC